MKLIFKPAVGLMNRLKYPQKFVLIGLLFAIALAMMLYLVISELNIAISFAKKERVGVEYIMPVKSLLEHTQRYRGILYATLEGDVNFVPHIVSAQDQIERDIQAIDAVDHIHGKKLKTTQKWLNIKKKWQELKTRVPPLTSLDTFNTYGGLITEITKLIEHAADTSNLILDPDLDTYYLMDTIVNKLPQFVKHASLIRGLGTPIKNAKEIDSDQRIQVKIYSASIKTLQDSVNENLAKVYAANPPLRNKLADIENKYNVEVKNLLQLSDSLIKAIPDSDFNGFSYFYETSKSIDTAFQLGNTLALNLDHLLEARIHRYIQKKIFVGSLTLIICALVVYLFISFYFAVIATVSHLDNTLQVMKRGNLRARANLQTKDELAAVAVGLNEMAGELQKMIERREQAAEEVFRQKELAEVTLHSIGDGVITIDAHGHIEYLNPVAENLTGWSHQEAQGQPVNDVFKLSYTEPSDLERDPIQQCLREGKILEFADPIILVNRFGNKIAIEEFAAPIRNSRGEIIGAVIVFHDVSGALEKAQRLSWQASHDALTGLVNRREFEYRLARAVGSAQESGAQHAFLYMDLDQFKFVNDSAGHIAGDELLRQLAELLRQRVRDNDTFARLGGDEFGVLLENCNAEQALSVAENLLCTVQDFRFIWEGRKFTVGASIGIVNIDRNSGAQEDVLTAADQACYEAKELGKNRIQVFKQDRAIIERRQTDLLKAQQISKCLEENRFLLFRQRLVPLSTGNDDEAIFEILLRMPDSQDSLLPYERFINIAQRYNLSLSINKWVIKQILALGTTPAYAHLTKEFSTNPCVLFINICSASLNDEDFIDFLKQEFSRSVLTPSSICFQIPETAVITNFAKAAKTIANVRAIGCKVCLSEFGAGASSFLYLKNISVDYLRIDAQFIKDLPDKPINQTMVEAINRIAHVLQVKTIAWKTDTPGELSKLKELGIDFAQGLATGEKETVVERSSKVA